MWGIPGDEGWNSYLACINFGIFYCPKRTQTPHVFSGISVQIIEPDRRGEKQYNLLVASSWTIFSMSMHACLFHIFRIAAPSRHINGSLTRKLKKHVLAACAAATRLPTPQKQSRVGSGKPNEISGRAMSNGINGMLGTVHAASAGTWWHPDIRRLGTGTVAQEGQRPSWAGRCPV